MAPLAKSPASAATAAPARAAGAIGTVASTGVAQKTFPGRRDQVSAVRRWVVDQLGDGHPAAWVAELVADELVTNAILHTRSGRPGGVVAVAVADGPWVWIGVYDQGGDSEPIPRQRVDVAAENGRGLAMVERLCLAWGYRPADLGRLVWGTVPAQPPTG